MDTEQESWKKLVAQQNDLILALSKELTETKSVLQNLKDRVEFYNPSWVQPPPSPPDPGINHPSLQKPSISPTTSTFLFYIFFLSAVLPSDPIRYIVSLIQILSKPPSLGPLLASFKPKYEILGKITRREPFSPEPKQPLALTIGRNGKIYAWYPKGERVYRSESEIVIFDFNGEFNSSFHVDTVGYVSQLNVNHLDHIIVVDQISDKSNGNMIDLIIREFSAENHKNISNWSSGLGSQRIAFSPSGLIYILRNSEDNFPIYKLFVYSPDKTLLTSSSDHEFLQSGVGTIGIDQDQNCLIMGRMNSMERALGVFSRSGEFLKEILLDLSPLNPIPPANLRPRRIMFHPLQIFVDKNGDIGTFSQYQFVVFNGDGSFKDCKEIGGSQNPHLLFRVAAIDENGTLVCVYFSESIQRADRPVGLVFFG